MVVTDKGERMDIISITFPIADHSFKCKGKDDATEPHIIMKGRIHVKVAYRMRGDKHKDPESHRYCPDCWIAMNDS